MPEVGKIHWISDNPKSALDDMRRLQLEILSLRAENRTLRLRNGRLGQQLEDLTEHMENDHKENDRDAHVAILAKMLSDAWWETGTNSHEFRQALGGLTSYLAGGRP